ncbi:MAG: hypothetical protein K2L73_01150 [Muribaculaceae bacterium]|nr:hypothetical protein [Muribaculaceae bacterium]
MVRLYRFFNSRNCTALLFLCAVIMTCVAYRTGLVDEITGSRGTLFPSPNLWLPPCDLSLVISLAVMALTSITFIALNKVFNFMRAPSALTSSLYVFMMASLPMASGQFYGGDMMCIIMLGVTAIMFSCFGDTSVNQRIFLIFFMLSLASTVQYAFMFYIVVAVPGLAQMRVLNLRSLVAMLLGGLSPFWILYGFGLIDFEDIHWPHFESTLSQLSVLDMVTAFSAVGVTVIVGFAAMCVNLIKILSYNAKFRAYNGFLTLLFIATVLFSIVDYVNLSVYYPLLCLTSAYQVAHYFSAHKQRGAVWVVLSVQIVYLIIYLACYFV